MKRQTDTAPETTTTTGSTPGAGRAANGKHIPSKRLKAWHRGSGARQPLKSFVTWVLAAARELGATRADVDRVSTVERWFANKREAP